MREKKFLKLIFNPRQRTRGFTLIELMIAATLIISVFGGLLALINYTVYALTYWQDSLTASFLAQEGIELVIKKRTENWIKGRSFTYQLENGNYQIDYLGTFSPATDQALKFDSSRGYQYSFGEPTRFKRTITLQKISPEHLRVLSKVSWQTRGNSFNLIVEDHLYDWFGVPAK